jgi:hypothetical protein
MRVVVIMSLSKLGFLGLDGCYNMVGVKMGLGVQV